MEILLTVFISQKVTRRKKIILRAKIMRNEGQTLNRIEVLGVKALRKPINLLTL